MPKPKPRKSGDDLADKIRRHLKAKETAKKKYALADRLLEEITKELDTGHTVKLSESKAAKLIDNFATKNIQWGHGSVRRYELEIVDL